MPRQKALPSIAYCTTAWNRLEHARTTIPQNMEDIEGIEGVCQVVLDYNSPDGLEAWVREHCMHWIESGSLAYFKETTRRQFNYAHAKNLAHKCADSDIVCNLDVDNRITPGFTEWLRERLVGERLFAKARRGGYGIQGRIAHWKSAFLALGGYDEAMGHGGHTMGDVGLIKRSLEYGLGMLQIPRRHESVIDHQRVEDYAERMMDNKHALHAALEAGRIVVNQGAAWGAGTVRKNFRHEIEIR